MADLHDQLMPDERYMRQHRRFLRQQRHEAKVSSMQNVNIELEPLERAHAEMRVCEIQLNHARSEIARYAALIHEFEHRHQKLNGELSTWKTTFESQLTLQKIDLSSRLNALTRRGGDLALIQEIDAEAAKLEGESIARQIGEVKMKLDRVKRLLAWKSDEPVVIKVHPPNVAEFTLEFETDSPFDHQVCANNRCGRVKINRAHPLCRNCQKLYAEGKINGDWVGIEIPSEVD